MVQRAYSYLRFSTPEQSRGDSFRRQTTLAASYAASHGLELDEGSFQDLGVSAFKGRNSEVGRLADFLEAVREGVIPPGSVLLVESLDRISRQSARLALRTLEEIVSEGLEVVTLSDGRSYTEATLNEDPLALISAILLFARANEESATKGARVRAAWDRKKREAADKPLTQVCPAWLRLKEDRSGFEVIPGRGEVVRRIYEMAAAGMGQNTIAATLNAEGVPTFGDHRKRAGTHWHRSYIAKVLNGVAAVGTYVPHSGQHKDGRLVRTPWEPVPNYYPAVVDPELARRARLVTGPGENPKRGRHAAHPVRNVLAGLARCPLCEGTMTRVSKGSRVRAGKPYLVCARAKAGAGCCYRAVPYENVERALRERADELVLKDRLEDQDPELDALALRRDDLNRRRSNLLAVMEDGGLDVVNRYAALGAELEEVAAAIRARIQHRESVQEPLVEKRMADLRKALKADPFDLEKANAALRLCADHATVDYRSGDLLVSWRHGGTTDLIYAWPEEELTGSAPTTATGPRR